MRIYIHCGNHDNSPGIADTVMFLKNALQDCGHTACISHSIVPGQVNIVMEHFVAEQHLRALLDGHAAGARFILIGTEPIVGGSFNGGVEGTHWHYSNQAYWKLRFESFKLAAKLADAIWVLAESMVPGYAQLFPELPVRFLPHGHVNNFATVQQRPEPERDIDFYFSGSLTEHRQRILRTLALTRTVVTNDKSTPEYLRQDQLSRSKVCLSLRLSPHNDIPSVSRMHFHLQNRSFLLHEAYALPCPLDPFGAIGVGGQHQQCPAAEDPQQQSRDRGVLQQDRRDRDRDRRSEIHGDIGPQPRQQHDEQAGQHQDDRAL